MRRLSPSLAFAMVSAIAPISMSAAAITVFITEDGKVAFSDGTPFAGSGYFPSQGTIVLCDGATDTNNPSTASKCAAGVVNSDIVNFGGTSNNIVMQSDKSPGDTNAADLLAFTQQFPGNTVFLSESAPNSSGLERVDWMPTVNTQPGYAAASGNTLQYEIVSDEASVPEPATVLTVVPSLLALTVLVHYRTRRALIEQERHEA